MIQLWSPERWRFGKELTTLQKEMDHLFEEFSNQFPRLTSRKDVDFVPACDIEETDTNYLVSIDLPGMKKEELKVECLNNVLTVSGEHKEEKREGVKGQRITERCHGRFRRSITLSEISDTSKIEANYADGVLRISIPKIAETAQKKQIPIGEGKPSVKIAKKEAEKATSESPKSEAA